MSPVLTQHVSQPITLDEQTQKMKRHLLQDIRRSAYVYRVDCGGCNACEIEIFAAITPVFDAERFGIKVVSSPPIFCYLLAQSPGRCVCLHFGRMSLPPIIKFVFPTARAVSAAVFSTISTASGAVATPLSPLMFGSPAARQHRPPPFTVSPWRSVCCNRRFTLWIIAIPPE